MKLKAFVIGLGLACAQVAQAHHDDDAFQDKVRQYILDHPEVILEALERLTERERRLERTRQIAAFPDLFERPAVLGLGEKDAPRVVIEFFDYKCIPCRSIHKRLSSLVDENPNLRVEMRHLPILTPASEAATRFALATWDVAGPDAYEAVHDVLWDHKGPYNTVVFSRIAGDLSLEFDKIEGAMWTDSVTSRIDENRDIAIALDIIGTPSFVTPEDVAIGTTDIERLRALFFNQ